MFYRQIRVPVGPAPERQHYRGFSLLGRSGPHWGRVADWPLGGFAYRRGQTPKPLRCPGTATLPALASIIRATVGASIRISPNYFDRWVERSNTPCRPLAFCESSRAVWRFSVGETNAIGELTSKVPKVAFFFTVKIVAPAGPPPENDHAIEDSTTWGAGARNLGDPVTGRPAKYGTFGTTLAPFPGERLGVFAQRTTLSGNRRYGWRPGR